MEAKPKVTPNTLARLEMAKARARIIGQRRQPNDGYDLEQAAEQWQRQKEQAKRSILGINQRSTSR